MVINLFFMRKIYPFLFLLFKFSSILNNAWRAFTIINLKKLNQKFITTINATFLTKLLRNINNLIKCISNVLIKIYYERNCPFGVRNRRQVGIIRSVCNRLILKVGKLRLFLTSLSVVGLNHSQKTPFFFKILLMVTVR